MGPLTLGDDADIAPLKYVGELIPCYTVRDSAVESEAFETSDIVARILT